MSSPPPCHTSLWVVFSLKIHELKLLHSPLTMTSVSPIDKASMLVIHIVHEVTKMMPRWGFLFCQKGALQLKRWPCAVSASLMSSDRSALKERGAFSLSLSLSLFPSPECSVAQALGWNMTGMLQLFIACVGWYLRRTVPCGHSSDNPLTPCSSQHRPARTVHSTHRMFVELEPQLEHAVMSHLWDVSYVWCDALQSYTH